MSPIAILALLTQFGVIVHAPSPTVYNEKQDEAVQITLPTHRYQCTRQPVVQHDDSMFVVISCHEYNQPAFLLGVKCKTEDLDHSVAMFSLNVGTALKPIDVAIYLSCQTIPAPSPAPSPGTHV